MNETLKRERQQQEERRAAEERRLAEQRLADQRRLDEQRQADQRRLDEQRRQEEQRRQAELRRRKESRQTEDTRQREPEREEQRKREERRKQEQTLQSQELRDLANTHDKYVRLIKSGYYEEQRAARAEAKAQGGEHAQGKESPAMARYKAHQEALKPKVEEHLKALEKTRAPELGRGR